MLTTSLEMLRGFGLIYTFSGGVFLAEEPTPSTTDICVELINVESYCLCIVELASVVALSSYGFPAVIIVFAGGD